jgi:iron complex outermembrane recepter protein
MYFHRNVNFFECGWPKRGKQGMKRSLSDGAFYARLRQLFAFLCLVAAAGLNHPARGQAAPAAESTDSTALAEIVVTAEKRSENSQKVPIAMSVLSSDQIGEAGATSAVDLNALVPGMQVVSSGPFAMVSIRGIGTQQVNAYGDPAVGYNVDGVIQDRTVNASAEFYDVDRVEVLKGPQGTIYGRNATAGAINVITNKPTDQMGGYVQADLGNYSSFDTSGAFNTPISDTVFARVAFQTVNHQGYFSNGANDANDVAGRLQVLYKPSSSVSLLLAADIVHQGGRGPEDEALPYGSGGQNPNNPWDQNFYHNAMSTAYPQSIYTINPYVNNTFWGIQGQLDWDLGPASLTVLSGFRSTKQDQDFYYGGIYEYVNNPAKQYTTEIRLGHAALDNQAGSLSWVGGLYFFKLTQTDFALYGLPCFCAADVSPIYTKSPNNVGRNLSDLDSLSYAAFAQATYAITDSLRATVGGRFTYDKKTEDGQGLVNLYSLGVVFPFPDVGKASWNNFSYKLGLEADIAPNSLLYGSVSTGYKAGGLNEGLNATNYAPEKLTAFAIGSKNQFFDRHLQVNAELFYWNYRDHQVAALALVNPAPNIGYVGVNIPHSTLKGMDLDAAYSFVTGTRVDLGAEYLDGKTGAYTVPTASGVNYMTNEAPMLSSPRFNLTLALNQDWNVASGTVTAGARAHHTTPQLLYAVINPDAFAPNQTTADVDLTYTAAKHAWFVKAYVKNITNEATLLSAFPGQTPRDSFGPNPFLDVRQYGFIGAPRTFGVRFGATFGESRP